MKTNTCEQCGNPIAPESPQGMCPTCLFQLAREDVNATQDRGPQIPQPPKPNEIAELFPELEILDLIRHGGMGYVYKARQKNLGRIVAVKLLSSSLLDDPSFAERFSREAKAMAMMNHPNIIAIYDFGQREKFYYLVMEYVDGLNLRQLVQSAGVKPEEAMQMVPQLCDALQYAHDRGVVHRDIKPENVLLSQEGMIKIADFGLAKLTNAATGEMTLTQTRQVMGTLNYMAPEQREKPVDVDHRADIYSLGVVIYELLTGELPLGRFAPPSNKVAIDVRLDEIVLRALEKEPSLRFQQASEMKTGIEGLSTPANVVGPERSAPTGKPSGIAKVMMFVLMSLALAFGIAGIVMIIISSDDISLFGIENTKTFGFIGLGVCGFFFAAWGIFCSIFYPSSEDSAATGKKASGKADPDADDSDQPKTVGGLILTGLALTMCFVTAGVFAIGSPIAGVQNWKVGVGCALATGCLFCIADLVDAGRRKRSSFSAEMQSVFPDEAKKPSPDDLPHCPRCRKQLPTMNADRCKNCGADWS